MPLVFKNSEKNAVIARIDIQGNLVTFIYRMGACRSGADIADDLNTAAGYVSVFNKNRLLKLYNPKVVEMPTDPRHKHIKSSETQLAHLHIHFDVPIEENYPAIKNIAHTIEFLQDKFGEVWTNTSEKFTKKYCTQSLCAPVLFPTFSKIVKQHKDFLSNGHYQNYPDCFLFKKMKTELLPCEFLPDDIPTQRATALIGQTTLSLLAGAPDYFCQNQPREITPLASNAQNTMTFHEALDILIVFLTISLLLMKRVSRQGDYFYRRR